jgi:DNA-binding NtrC family response regulator
MNNNKILIVEDEEDINELLKDYLEMKGYSHVTTVTKGRQALELIKKDKPDIVFLDIVLEDDVDGMEVLKEGRAVSAQTKFVMMSAYKDEYGQKAKDLGACAFLGKPVEMNAIKNILKEMIG